MRIIGEIAHPVLKITVLKMNEKVTLQVEDRLVTQSYVFRDGSGVHDLPTVQELLTPSFLTKIEQRFKEMNRDYIDALEQLNAQEFEDFDII